MSVSVAKLFALVGGVLVIITTFAFAGRMPLAGRGNTTPPPVMVALTLAIKAGSVHKPFQVSAAVGQVIFSEDVLNGFCPTWKKTISWSYSTAEQASTKTLCI